ncbi:hypothetical protein QE152_g19955 [Popillia japonica]|uniref:Gustatory receptor n=1 Tax=Popillia japonica TaxID=7064 RepID=A0AAW1KQZ5_POPJA
MADIGEARTKFTDENFNIKSNLTNHFLCLISCKILGLKPWQSNKCKSIYLQIFDKLYFLLTIIVLAMISSYVLKHRLSYHENGFIHILTGRATYISLIILNFYCIINIRLKYKDYDKFLSQFRMIDEIIYKYINRISEIKPSYLLKSGFLTAILPLLFFIGQMAVIWTRGSKVTSWLSMEFFQRYHVLFSVFLLQYYIHQIGLRYEVIGKIIHENFYNIQEKNQIKQCLCDMFECILHQTDLVHMFNRIFGLQLVIFTYNTILSLLFLVDTTLVNMKMRPVTSVTVLTFTTEEIVGVVLG